MTLKVLVAIIAIALAMVRSTQSTTSEESDYVCICTRVLNPVCASNGVTYANPCIFDCNKSKNQDLYIKFKGNCDTKHVDDSPESTF